MKRRTFVKALASVAVLPSLAWTNARPLPVHRLEPPAASDELHPIMHDLRIRVRGENWVAETELGRYCNNMWEWSRNLTNNGQMPYDFCYVPRKGIGETYLWWEDGDELPLTTPPLNPKPRLQTDAERWPNGPPK